MSAPSTLATPVTAAEVDELLATERAVPVPIAGGTDLLVARRAGRPTGTMVDLTNLTDVGPPIQVLGDALVRLSATAPIADVAAELGARMPALRAAIKVFASPQIRNRASIGGNLGTASPSGDLMPPLVAAEARVLVRGAAGRREIPIEEFLRGPRRTDLQPGEWIYAVDVPDSQGTHGFRKVGGRQALAISVVNLAWQWTVAPDGRLRRVRLAVGAAAPTVIRCKRAEQVLEGRAPTRNLVQQAAAELGAELAPIDDLRGSAAYRRSAAGGLLIEALLPLLDAPGGAMTSGKDER